MAVWILLNKKYKWKQVAEIAINYQLQIGDFERYDLGKKNHNAMRVGFASYNNEEIYDLINKLKKTMKQL